MILSLSFTFPLFDWVFLGCRRRRRRVVMRRRVGGRRALLHRWKVVGSPVRWRVVGSLRRMVVLVRTALVLHASLVLGVPLLFSAVDFGRAAADGIAQGTRGSSVVPIVQLSSGFLRRRFLHRGVLLPLPVPLWACRSGTVPVALRSRRLSR